MSVQPSFDATPPPTPSATKKMLRRLSWRKSAPVTFTLPAEDTRDASPPRVAIAPSPSLNAPAAYTPIEEEDVDASDVPPTPTPAAMKKRKRLSWRRSAPVLPASAPAAYPPYPFAPQRMSSQSHRSSSQQTSMPSHYVPFHHAPTHHAPTAAAHARAMRRQSLPVSALRSQPTKHTLARTPSFASFASIASIQSTSSTASSRIQGRLRPSNESRTTLHSYVQGRKNSNRRKSTQLLFNVVSSLMLIMPSTATGR